MSNFHALTVSEITKLTSNSVCIGFEIPSNLKEAFTYLPGQYITFKYNHDGNELRRAYSICSAPSENMLRVGVKKVKEGVFSVFANEELKVGDTLEVMIPEGKFTVSVAQENTKNYMAFVAGSGITPVLSIIKSVLKKEINSTFTLVYGNQSVDETMFYAEILALQKQYGERFSVEFIFSRKQEGDAMFGRIERSTVNFLFKKKLADITFDDYFLCGPEPMIDAVSSLLKERGVNEKQIHFELFTTSEKGLLVEAHEGMTKVTITLDFETETFTMSQKNSVLQAAMDEGLDPPYSCQGGICSTCIARIKEGSAEMRKNQILTDEELTEGLILTCQAHPTTPTLVVDYDDV